MKYALLLILLIGVGHHNSQAMNLAFYYGENAPLAQLRHFDGLVLQGNITKATEVSAIAAAGTIPIAYLSVFEVARSDKNYHDIPKEWSMGQNTDWRSDIMDLRIADYQAYLFDQAQLAFDAGFQGLFLDTLDSYELLSPEPNQRAAFVSALVEFIMELRTRHPDSQIILNRGFAALPQIHEAVNAVAFESLYAGYDAAANKYTRVNAERRYWLLEEVKKIQSEYQLPVIAIDYVDSNDPEKADQVAASIMQHDITPWVANAQLSNLGRGRYKPVPRKVIGISDQGQRDIPASLLHRFAATPLEYLGYQLDYYHTEEDQLPEFALQNRYAGIVVWLEGEFRPMEELCTWLQEQSEQKIPVVFMGYIPESRHCLQIAGARYIDGPSQQLSITSSNRFVGNFEGKLRTPSTDIVSIQSIGQQNSSWLQLNDAAGKKYNAIVTGPWGGYAVHPFLFETMLDEEFFWLFNAVRVFSTALQLQTFPTPVVTTESGRRILTAHIDGDGFVSSAEMPGTPLAADIIGREILQKYQFPHTVSVIEAEVSSDGLYPEKAERAQDIARELFALPWVEIASHSYSHPFYWRHFEGTHKVEGAPFGYNMPVKDYVPNMEREVKDSIDFINQQLAPPDKPVKVFLWTGDSLPGRTAYGFTRLLDVYNVNGGFTRVLPHSNSITGVSPIGRQFDDGWQIYAPVQNENEYTNTWRGPFYGYRNVIDTFTLLEQPRRLKPISIYYHFYSGTKIASLKALREVYDWASSQETTPMYLSDYAERAETWYNTSLAKSDDGSWLVAHDGVMNTFRLPADSEVPDLAASDNVIGFRRTGDALYIHTTGQRANITLTENKPLLPYLSNANAIIDSWKVSGIAPWTLEFSAHGAQQIELHLANAQQCQLVPSNSVPASLRLKQRRVDPQNLQLLFTSSQVQQVTLTCQ